MIKQLNFTEYDLEVFGASPLFIGLTPDEIKAMTKVAEVYRYSIGETIFEKGTSESSLYVVSAGCVDIVDTLEDGTEVLIAILTRGNFFGEMSFVSGEKRTANATAKEQTGLLKLSMKPFLTKSLDEIIKGKIMLNIARKLVLRLQKLNLEHMSVLNQRSEYLRDNSSPLVQNMVENIAHIRGRYLI